MKIFLIGPGGVGKTTCGKILAKLLECNFIDLDEEFCKQVENIGNYINTKGYKKYCLENSELFYEILAKNPGNFVFSLSSGFLVHEDLDDLTSKHKQTLKIHGITILLLPSESLDKSVDIVAKRQLSRGFGLNEKREKEKFTHRFPIYKALGDIRIFSQDKPEFIAKQMKKEIELYIKVKNV